MTRRASVIIPAHEEQETIPAGLGALLAGMAADEFQVIVVANGCSDATAEVARQTSTRAGIPIEVVEIGVASKAVALNVGDDRASAFPRVYLDADVICPTTTLRRIVAELEKGPSELVVPTRELDLSSASWWVRHYYLAWLSLPRVRAELSGRGAYAFSRSGRARFSRFPVIVADDYWAVRQVPRHLASVVSDQVAIRPPRRLRYLVAVRGRIYASNRAAGLPRGAHVSISSDVEHMLRTPERWLSFGIFLLTNAYARLVRGRHHGVPGRDAQRGWEPLARTTTQRPGRLDDESV